jgi:hypothetical protein
VPAYERFRGDVVSTCDRPTMNKLRGIELRYVLTMHLAVHGRATIKDLVEALASTGSWLTARPVNPCRTRCGGSGAAGGRAASRAAYTVPVNCRAAPSTGFIDEYSRCGPITGSDRFG